MIIHDHNDAVDEYDFFSPIYVLNSHVEINTNENNIIILSHG